MRRPRRQGRKAQTQRLQRRTALKPLTVSLDRDLALVRILTGWLDCLFGYKHEREEPPLDPVGTSSRLIPVGWKQDSALLQIDS